MPTISHKYIKSNVLTGVWRIDEDEAGLREILNKPALPVFSVMQRNLHWLASRCLLTELLAIWGHEGNFSLERLDSGKPVLTHPRLEISISHAGKYAAVAIGTERAGIDIEQISPRIRKIRSKFMNEPECQLLKDDNDLEWMYSVWSAKEALFKYDEEGALDFREHLSVKKGDPGYLIGQIHKGRKQLELLIPCEKLEDYILCCAYKK